MQRLRCSRHHRWLLPIILKPLVPDFSSSYCSLLQGVPLLFIWAALPSLLLYLFLAFSSSHHFLCRSTIDGERESKYPRGENQCRGHPMSLEVSFRSRGHPADQRQRPSLSGVGFLAEVCLSVRSAVRGGQLGRSDVAWLQSPLSRLLRLAYNIRREDGLGSRPSQLQAHETTIG